MHLSVIIPAYNESKRITKTLLDIHGYLSKQDYAYEILVINDGSTDNTAEVVVNLKPEVSNLRLIDNKENHGKGYVVKKGMLEAKGDFRLFMDADNSTTIDNLDKFWSYTKEGYDIVIGSIEVEGSQIHEDAQWYRRIAGRGSKYLISFMTGLWEIKDTQRGFKLFTAESAEKVFSKARVDRFGFDFEALALAKKNGI